MWVRNITFFSICFWEGLVLFFIEFTSGTSGLFLFITLFIHCVCVYTHTCTQVCIRHTCGSWGTTGRCLFPPLTLWVQGVEVMLSDLVVSTFTPGAMVLVSGVFWGKILRNDTMSYYRSVHFLCFISVCTYVLLGGGNQSQLQMCSSRALLPSYNSLCWFWIAFV